MRQAAIKNQSRAEAVRSRRAPRPTRVQYTPQQLDQARQKARKPVATRPITSRGVVMPGTSGYNQRRLQTGARRQYYVSLPATPGAEVRLPALPRISLGWRALSLGIAVMMLFAIYSAFYGKNFMIDTPTVVGAQRLTAEDIASALDATGTPAVLAQPTQMARELQAAFPELSSVKVSLGFPAKLTVAVQERVPVLNWNQEGKAAWIDLDGYAFEPRGDASYALINVDAAGSPPAPAAAVVPATGDATATGTDAATAEQPDKTAAPARDIALPTPSMMPELVSAIITLGTQVPEGTSIVYDPAYGLGWDDPRGWKVYIGRDLNEMELKMTQYNAIVEQLQAQGVTPAMISVEFPRAPFYRVEP